MAAYFEVLWADRTPDGYTAAASDNRKVTVYLKQDDVWQQVTGSITFKESEQWYMRGSQPQPVTAETAAALDGQVGALFTNREGVR